MLSVPTTYHVVSSMIPMICFWPYRLQAPKLNSWPCCHAPRDGICTESVRGTSRGHEETLATLSHQMPPVGATYRVLLSIIQLLLALRLISHPSSIFGHARMFPGTGLPSTPGGTWKISSYPCLRNTVRFQDLPGTSVDVASAFGFKAVRPPSSILVHARILSGTAFSRHGSC